MSLKEYIPAIKYGNQLVNGELDPQVTAYATLNLTSAQILALNTTPVTIVTTSTSGTAIIPDSLFFEMNPGTVPYASSNSTVTSGTFLLSYNSVTTGGNVMAINVPITVITSSTAGYFASPTATSFTPVPNTGVTIGQSNGLPLISGNGTAKVILSYYIVTI